MLYTQLAMHQAELGIRQNYCPRYIADDTHRWLHTLLFPVPIPVTLGHPDIDRPCACYCYRYAKSLTPKPISPMESTAQTALRLWFRLSIFGRLQGFSIAAVRDIPVLDLAVRLQHFYDVTTGRAGHFPGDTVHVSIEAILCQWSPFTATISSINLSLSSELL